MVYRGVLCSSKGQVDLTIHTEGATVKLSTHERVRIAVVL